MKARKIKGRTRHLVVDTLGLLLVVCLGRQHPRSRQRKARGGASGGPFSPVTADLVDGVTQRAGWVPQIVKRSDAVTGFVFLPKRWIVDRPLPGSGAIAG